MFGDGNHLFLDRLIQPTPAFSRAAPRAGRPKQDKGTQQQAQRLKPQGTNVRVRRRTQTKLTQKVLSTIETIALTFFNRNGGGHKHRFVIATLAIVHPLTETYFKLIDDVNSVLLIDTKPVLALPDLAMVDTNPHPAHYQVTMI